jgi:hypothetical protein
MDGEKGVGGVSGRRYKRPTFHAGWMVYIRIRRGFCDFRLETTVMLPAGYRRKLSEEKTERRWGSRWIK